jgi:acetate kinase
MSELEDPCVLAVNAGSSTLKFGLYRSSGGSVWSGTYEGLEPGGAPRVRGLGAATALEPSPGESGFDVALRHLVAALVRHGAAPVAVAHRIVHGGERCIRPCRLDAPTMTYLHTLDPLAPLHQPHNLAGVDAFAAALPGVPQIGCFDTAFHATMPEVERRLPIARELEAMGLRRFGFHGLSYQYVVRSLRGLTPRLKGRAVLAHLGNGASVCATVNGESVATSMGFSALEGLMMGTRSGSLDPGVLLYLWRQGWDLARVERLLYKESGLKGVSGISADLRTLRASDLAQAGEAIALFTQRLKREVGAMLAILDGVDLIGFTGGIGEHDAILRAELAQVLSFAGVRLDATANVAARGDSVVPIHTAGSTVEVWVVPTDEGRVAAQAAFDLMATPKTASQ